MVIDIHDQKVRVRFHYYTDSRGYRVSKAMVENLKGDDWIMRSMGLAECSTEDQFARKFGRKKALTRALSFELKEFRSIIWRALFEKGMKV